MDQHEYDDDDIIDAEIVEEDEDEDEKQPARPAPPGTTINGFPELPNWYVTSTNPGPPPAGHQGPEEFTFSGPGKRSDQTRWGAEIHCWLRVDGTYMAQYVHPAAVAGFIVPRRDHWEVLNENKRVLGRVATLEDAASLVQRHGGRDDPFGPNGPFGDYGRKTQGW